MVLIKSFLRTISKLKQLNFKKIELKQEFSYCLLKDFYFYFIILIFSEPGFSHLEALSPYMPVAARVFHLPIDTRFNHQAAAKVIDGLSPRRVVVPSSYLKPPVFSPHRSDLILNLVSKIFGFFVIKL